MDKSPKMTRQYTKPRGKPKPRSLVLLSRFCSGRWSLDPGRSSQSRFLLGLALSALALWLAVRQVELDQVLAAFARADYGLVAAAVAVQLAVLWAIAGRWARLFRNPLPVSHLLRVLLIAQLANVVLPVRLGVLLRAYLVGQEARVSKTLVFGTVVAEKVFDSLMFVLLFVIVMPFVAPAWFRWSALPSSTGLFLALFPAMVLVTVQRRRFLQLARAILKRLPWAQRFSLPQRLETVLEGLSPLHGMRPVAVLWGWTLLISALGALVNVIVMRAFGIQAPWTAAFFLLAVLQMGARIPAPLGGIGIFQYLCVQALSFFSVDANLALSFGFMLHFVVFVPGSLLGALSLYRMHASLFKLRDVAGE